MNQKKSNKKGNQTYDAFGRLLRKFFKPQHKNVLITQLGKYTFDAEFVLCYHHSTKQNKIVSEVVSTSPDFAHSMPAFISLLSYFKDAGVDVVGLCKHIGEIGEIPDIVTEHISIDQLVGNLAAIDHDVLMGVLDQPIPKEMRQLILKHLKNKSGVEL